MKSGKQWLNTAAACVQGASHVKNNLPCQDALKIDNTGEYCIIAVSDGHGSDRCKYSAEGAQFAVDVACDILSNILKEKDTAYGTISANRDIWLPKQIEKKWKSAVEKIHEGREEAFDCLLYGATLLALAVTKDFIFALQLGDGDILSVDEGDGGEPLVDWFIPPDERIGNETDSLCQDSCWQYMRSRLIHKEQGYMPAMFLMSTDGYSNSFNTGEGFKKAGADFYNMWVSYGLKYIHENLEGWLIESSTKGSGDDIAMALICNRRSVDLINDLLT